MDEESEVQRGQIPRLRWYLGVVEAGLEPGQLGSRVRLGALCFSPLGTTLKSSQGMGSDKHLPMPDPVPGTCSHFVSFNLHDNAEAVVGSFYR